MTVLRKLLLPILAFCAAVLFALLAFFALNISRMVESNESQNLMSLDHSFQARLSSLEDLAVALSTEAANDPEIQAAFAAQDRQKLISLTYSGYQQLDSQFHIPQYQFHTPPAISFLRLHQIDQFGDDLSSFRKTVVIANSEHHTVKGLEIGRGGLGIRGVVPMYFQGSPIGSVEFGMNVDAPLLEQLKTDYGADWQILLSRPAMEIASVQPVSGDVEGPNSELILQASTLSKPIYTSDVIYQQALNGSPMFSQVTSGSRSFSIYSVPLQDYSGQTIGVVDILSDRTAVLADINLRLLIGSLALLVSLMVGGLGLALITRRTLKPIETVTAYAQEVATGNLDQTLAVDSQDELGKLANSFNFMTMQLRDLVHNLEARVEERTQQLNQRSQQLQTAAEVARDLITSPDLETLLPRACQMIQTKLGYASVSVFLVDEMNEFAHLQTSSSAAGQTLIQAGFRIRVGQQGLVGQAISHAQLRVALDVDAIRHYLPDLLLPETRSEAVFPLLVGARVIGALEIQSSQRSAFSPEDVTILQSIADQLAISIEHARLVADLETRLEESRQKARIQVRDDWAVTNNPDQVVAFEYDRLQIKAAHDPLPKNLQTYADQLRAGQAVVVNPRLTAHGNGRKGSNPTILVVPVILRSELIGVIGLEEKDPNHLWTNDEIAVVQATANQAALTLENARLLEESRQQAEREALISQVAANVRATLDMDTILKTAIREIGSALDYSEVEVRLAPSHTTGETV